MKVFPCAKINLGLNVVARRADGYHDLQTVFYPVNMYDEMEINVRGGMCPGRNDVKVEVECGDLLVAGGGGEAGAGLLGSPDDNLVARAYRLLASDYDMPAVDIYLRKHIPVQAGMGGGSADCAYTLRALNRMACLGIDDDGLRRYASRLGADCAFFVNPVPSYAEGIGDRLTPVQLDLSGYKIAIVKPPVTVSTREAFAGVKTGSPARKCRDIVAQPVETWRGQLYNDFETTVFALHRGLRDVKERLYSLGAIYASMSGSGSAVYGIFRGAPDLAGEFGGCYTALV